VGKRRQRRSDVETWGIGSSNVTFRPQGPLPDTHASVLGFDSDLPKVDCNPDVGFSLRPPPGVPVRAPIHGSTKPGRSPWKRIRCGLGLGTSAASRCMNSSGDITMCVMPSRQAVLSLSTTCSTGVTSLGCVASSRRSDGQRQYPRAHRHVRDHVIDHVRRRLRHAPGPARPAKASALAAEGNQFVVTAVTATRAQEAVGEDVAFEEGVEVRHAPRPNGRSRRSHV